MYLLLFVLVGAAAVLALSWWLFFHQSPKEQSFFFRCPACGQKLRYLARKAGRSGMCPRCKKPCTFPSRPQEALDRPPTGEESRVRFGRLAPQSADKTPTP
jgi:hypothetical protein